MASNKNAFANIFRHLHRAESLGDSMKKLLMLVPPAALAALLVPALAPRPDAAAEGQKRVQRAAVLAAVDLAEAQRRAAATPKAPPGDAAAALDKLAGAATKLDPARIDPKLAANAVAR
jgi:hypothetical protein